MGADKKGVLEKLNEIVLRKKHCGGGSESCEGVGTGKRGSEGRDPCGSEVESKIDVRFHLSKHLTRLLRSASLLKRELSWAMCGPNSELVFRINEQLVAFRDQLLEKKQLDPASPAATIGRPQRNSRKEAELEATLESVTNRDAKKPNQKSK